MGTTKAVTWATCRGRNTWDHPLEVPDDMGVECLNVNLNTGELGGKRAGMASQTLDSSSHSLSAGIIRALGRFVPGQDESAAELHVIQGSSNFFRFASGNVIPATLSTSDGWSGDVEQTVTVQLNNKLFYAYDSAVNRLHKYDPQLSTTAISRTGLAAPAAPTAADTGAGGPPATIRWYVQAYRIKVGPKIVSQSEFSAAVARTNTAGSQTRVTKSATISEGETHWVLAASADSISGPFYEIAETAVGTTTYDDAATPSTYSTHTAIPTVGSYYPFPSVKFLSTDGTHLFGLGVWESSAGVSVAPVSGRLYFTPAIGSSSNPVTDDDERINNTSGTNATTGWIDLNIGARGVDRGLSEWVHGVMFAFQSSAIYMIIPTGTARVPFRAILLTDRLGALSHRSILTAPDEAGNPCVYFWSPQNGPNRITVGGDIQWLGKDIYTDIVTSVNVSATVSPCHGVYDALDHQVKWWLAMGSETSPDGTAMAVFHPPLGRLERGDAVRGGWAKWTGNVAKAECSIQFAKSFATATRPSVNVTYVGSRVANGIVGVQDGTATQDYNATNYQGYVESKAFDAEPIGRRKRLKECYVVAGTASGVTIRNTILKDWGTESFTHDILLTASASSETYKRSDRALDVGDCVTFSSRIGDSAAQNVALWTAERFQAIYDVTETS